MPSVAVLPDARLDLLAAWAASAIGADFTIAPASVDASFRRYFRITPVSPWRGHATLIAMDAPPPQELQAIRARRAHLLHTAGLHAPAVLGSDIRAGFCCSRSRHANVLDALASRIRHVLCTAPSSRRECSPTLCRPARWQSRLSPGVAEASRSPSCSSGCGTSPPGAEPPRWSGPPRSSPPSGPLVVAGSSVAAPRPPRRCTPFAEATGIPVANTTTKARLLWDHRQAVRRRRSPAGRSPTRSPARRTSSSRHRHPILQLRHLAAVSNAGVRHRSIVALAGRGPAPGRRCSSPTPSTASPR